MEALITIWIAAIGLSVGSFLNVVIARVPNDESVVRPRSKCPKCGHQLPWYENIPVLSWLFLRGRCSGCKAPISPRYILVELLTGTLFVAATARYGFDWPLVSALTFFSLLIPLIFIDAEHWILPFELTLPAIAAGLLLAIPQGKDAFLVALVGAIAAFLIFRTMEIVGWLVTGREALGAGDKYLMAMIGAQVGWRALLGVILFSSLQGAVVGLVRMKLTGRAGPPTPEVDQKKDEAPKLEAPKSEAPKSEAPKSEEPKPDVPAAEAPSPEEPKPDVPGAEAPKPEAPKPEEPKPEEPKPEEEEEEPKREPFTPSFLAPGLPFWKRLLLIPYTIFLQDIPDSPPPDESTGEIPDWVPQANNIPFGPWIGLAGIEVMLLGPAIVERLSDTPWRLLSEIVFGR